MLLAEEWGPPSGAVVLAVTSSLLDAAPVAHLPFLLVSADARRRGIGRLLVKSAAQAARRLGCATLVGEAPAGGASEAALGAFWAANGFACAGNGWSRPLRKGAAAAEG